jgi:hypothetical protein
VAASGLTYLDKDGVTRPSPLLAEIRSTTLVLTRVLAPIQLDAAAVVKDQAMQHAGHKSWEVRSARPDLRGAIPKG